MEGEKRITLGEKNKKSTGNCGGWLKKAVGERVGFSIGTQDSRIRKYEKDMMAPKEDIRIKIAEALDIDMSALNDIDIQTEEDAIRILFYLERKIWIGNNKENVPKPMLIAEAVW